jgi:hypothetical protein
MGPLYVWSEVIDQLLVGVGPGSAGGGSVLVIAVITGDFSKGWRRLLSFTELNTATPSRHAFLGFLTFHPGTCSLFFISTCNGAITAAVVGRHLIRSGVIGNRVAD